MYMYISVYIPYGNYFSISIQVYYLVYMIYMRMESATNSIYASQQQVLFFLPLLSAADCSWNYFFFLVISSMTGLRVFLRSSLG